MDPFDRRAPRAVGDLHELRRTGQGPIARPSRGTVIPGTRGFAAQSDRPADAGTARTAPAVDRPVAPIGLGLSRDAASLCWSARRLLAAGNKTEALNMYLRALAVLTPAEPFRSAIPRFCDDPNVPRYLLPGEERQREILRELVANESAFPEWSAAIPKNLTTTLAAARLLKEKGSREADALLDRRGDRAAAARRRHAGKRGRPGGAG